MIDEDIYRRLVESGIRYVSFRPRSEKEMRTYLRKKLDKRNESAGGEVFEAAVARLRDLGYVDDNKFVLWWIDQRTSHRPKGTRYIARELHQKGVDKEFYEEILKSDSELDRAKTVVLKKGPMLQKLSPEEQKKKIYGLLGIRGFSGETISRVIDEIGRLDYNKARKLRY